MNAKERVFEKLNSLDIKYQVSMHPAVFTIEEMESLEICKCGDVCKNLFLRDTKGKRHFLLVFNKDKKADLKSIQKQLGCTNLSFASEERLYKYLQLEKGAVTPLGIINDRDCFVEVVFDNELIGKPRLGIHPNDNTATVWVSYEDLRKVIEQNGNLIHFISLNHNE